MISLYVNIVDKNNSSKIHNNLYLSDETPNTLKQKKIHLLVLQILVIKINFLNLIIVKKYLFSLNINCMGMINAVMITE